MARDSEVFSDGYAVSKVLEVKSWLKSRGGRDFEPVVDQLTKVNGFSVLINYLAKFSCKEYGDRDQEAC
jgi:hypothetical protein